MQIYDTSFRREILIQGGLLSMQKAQILSIFLSFVIGC